jgi:hypothetical protein
MNSFKSKNTMNCEQISKNKISVRKEAETNMTCSQRKRKKTIP